MNETTSVIVPIYNSAPCLRKCLNSIFSQTYPDLEIVAVNDGSTDESGRILDDLSRTEPRLRVLTQENRGVSAARNAGILAAKGKWLLFADSDDHIADTACEAALAQALSCGADMVLFGAAGVIDKTGNTYPIAPGLPDGLCPKEEVLRALASYTASPYVWGKLFRRELFDGIRFPEGELWEDCAVILQITDRAERICALSQPLYFYHRRSGSLTKSAQEDLSVYRWRYLQYGRQYAFLYKNYPEIAPEMAVLREESCLKYCALCAGSSGGRRQFRQMRACIMRGADEDGIPIPDTDALRFRMTFARKLLICCPPLFRIFSRLLLARMKKKDPWQSQGSASV